MPAESAGHMKEVSTDHGLRDINGLPLISAQQSSRNAALNYNTENDLVMNGHDSVMTNHQRVKSERLEPMGNSHKVSHSEFFSQKASIDKQKSRIKDLVDAKSSSFKK